MCCRRGREGAIVGVVVVVLARRLLREMPIDQELLGLLVKSRCTTASQLASRESLLILILRRFVLLQRKQIIPMPLNLSVCHFD